MPAIDFPASPSINDEYSFEGRTWRWNGTGWEVKEYPAALLAGTAANPSLYFTGDGNTGLYSPGADQVAISTGGAGRLFINSSGQVGVGTNSLLRPFTVAGSAVFVDTVQATVWPQVASNVAGFGTNNNYPVALVTNGGERVRITEAGLVGIGTKSPGANLEIGIVASANQTLKINSSANNYLELSTTGATGEHKITAGNSASGTAQLIFETASGGVESERVRIDSSGRLHSPSFPDAGFVNSWVLRATSGATNETASLETITSAGGERFALAMRSSATTGNTSGNIEGSLSFASQVTRLSSRGSLVFNTASTERLRISEDGSLSAVIPGGSTLYPASMCRAWVNFNGTGTVAIRASYNVSSITDNGTGDYTVNFTTAMPDASYSVVGTADFRSGGVASVAAGMLCVNQASTATPMTASSVRLRSLAKDVTGLGDAEFANVAIFR